MTVVLTYRGIPKRRVTETRLEKTGRNDPYPSSGHTSLVLGPQGSERTQVVVLTPSGYVNGEVWEGLRVGTGTIDGPQVLIGVTREVRQMQSGIS